MCSFIWVISINLCLNSWFKVWLITLWISLFTVHCVNHDVCIVCHIHVFVSGIIFHIKKSSLICHWKLSYVCYITEVVRLPTLCRSLFSIECVYFVKWLLKYHYIHVKVGNVIHLHALFWNQFHWPNCVIPALHR